MDFSLTEEQELLKHMVERFNAERGADEREVDPARWAMLAELGLLALPFAAEQGGFGGDPVDTITAMEALGRGYAPEPVLVELYLGGRMLALAGGDVSGVIAGEGRYGLALAEPASRYRFDQVATQAREQGGAWRLTGEKCFVLGAATSGYIVSASSGGGMGLYLVAADAEGLARTDYRLLDGSQAADLVLRDVAAARLAGGFDLIDPVLDGARLAAAAEMIGVMGRMFDDTLDYLRTRQQFGVAIGSFQAIQHRMADQYAALEQSRSLLYRAALIEGGERAAAITAASAYVGAAAIRLAEECVQLHGGMGVSDELAVGQGLKRVLVLANLFGHPDDTLARYAAITSSQADAMPAVRPVAMRA